MFFIPRDTMSPLPLPVPVDQTTPSATQYLTIRFLQPLLHLLVTRDDSDDTKCHPQPNIDLCEKPAAADDKTGLVIGVTIGVVVAATLTVLVFFHLRRQRRDRSEWPKNSQELDDYGVAPMPKPKPKLPSTVPSNNVVGGAPPRPANAYRQPRVEPDSDNDMDIDEPPKRRDSLQSLARSLRGNPEAYRSRRDDTSADMKPVEPASQL
ncbi:hypothetical protein GGR54DRAFT_620166 [Hypoxylon sp. NC1633]|nr:hypothetical protein GGR54DRAFT_620166 [Hypoxylon sp. NC1633]